MDNQLYDEEFYNLIIKYNYPSAQTVVPLVAELVKPKSIIDFGCGVGCWLKAFDEYCKLKRMMGLEGDWLVKEKLMVSEKNIRYVDFMNDWEISSEELYDLAICLEVAEHLNEERGNLLLDNMTKVSNIILFSAAIPQQGGSGHVNERWQSYWIQKFQDRKYVCADIIRPNIWGNSKVLAHYRQNMFLFVRKEYIEKIPVLQEYIGYPMLMDVVHPDIYSQQRVARKFMEKNKENEFLAKKYCDLFSLMLIWMEKEVNGKHLNDWLQAKEIRNIAIYGIGKIGKMVYKLLKNTNIEVLYAIDRLDDIIYEDIKIYHLSWEIDLPYVDAVIVTPIQDYIEINNELSLKLDTKILNFADIVEDL